MQIPSPEDLILVGRIVRTHGLKGECKILPESDDPNRLLTLKRIWLGTTPQITQLFNITSARLQTSKKGATVLMQFEGIQSINDAQHLAKSLAFADVNDLPSLEPGEFFLHDLIGMEVVSDSGESIGTVKDIWAMQSYPMYVVERSGMKEALIPGVPEFIISTDVDQGRITIQTVEGLLDS